MIDELKNIEYVLFDLDGTVSDSSEGITKSADKSIMSVSVSKLSIFLKSKTFVLNGDVTFRLENIPVISYPRFFALPSAARPRFPYPTIPIFIKHRLFPIICVHVRRFTSRGAPIFHNMLLTGVLKKFPLGKIIVYIIASIRRCRYDKTR